jgi:pimeloyl-CoA dehydrogenase large subunit
MPQTEEPPPGPGQGLTPVRHKYNEPRQDREPQMDLNFTQEEIAFRDEARHFFRTAVPQSIRDKIAEGEGLTRDDMITAQRILNKRGWATVNWPVEWGGQDWTPIQVYLYQDEMQQANCPAPIAFNVSMVGPVIAQFGSQEIKERFLPATANVDIFWCQGFSEPGSGSDLASLRTKAEKKDGKYIINGQKTWTTLAQYADWIFCLCRTDPTAKAQEGISFILVDMKTPGITVRPIVTIDGGREVNEVFFDNVEVPLENLVGEENKGWDYAKFLLGNERTGIARVGASKAKIARIKELASLEFAGERPLMETARFQEKLAAVEVELKALEMTQLRVVSDERKLAKGRQNPASSILKLKGSVIQQQLTELLMEVVGPYVMPYQRDFEGKNEPVVGPDYATEAAPMYFNYRKVSIYGGSNEIQHNIIAKAILGL